MFVLIVQEDAKPRAEPPIRNESLWQPSVRVHLQHFPRWALQHVRTGNSHTCLGHPKLCRDPEMCAPLLMSQSHLVWRRERFPLFDCRQLKREEQAGGDGSGALWECAFRFTQTLHYSPGQQRLSLKSPAAFCDSASQQTACLQATTRINHKVS